ncbi:MAG: dihydroorotate dehydrogenase electron transfer subunit [Ignavibacteria bacterium]|nr:dihydroorotate dehydrogenase electron transfer subunit [Ignavibacteria bacterium]
MKQSKLKIDSIEKLESNTFLISLKSNQSNEVITPGQFYNIKVSDNDFPLLRRPFSICDFINDRLYFMFDIHGEGTKMLSQKRIGEELDLLGPLGNGFDLSGDFDTAIIIAGGIGAAPFPYLIRKMPENKNVVSFLGAKSKSAVVKYGLKKIFISTDDGSEGFHGNVVHLFKSKILDFVDKKIKIYACGPTPMLISLQEFVIQNKIDCQISTECSMACGFGICQGCPIEKSSGDGYLLVCKDGPVFNANAVKL